MRLGLHNEQGQRNAWNSLQFSAVQCIHRRRMERKVNLVGSDPWRRHNCHIEMGLKETG
jgi:hypothetical protein